ncbi:proline-serine-threonine phosphatase-interacting protein 1-like [Periophthalmus magnuspinnatus]|uniref:proline-serine-threonine phosphatase-interacting protein 1-like n=1 Tax=Periophthalmus magnuspinnatus TaxID=409849 RepID=UPI00145AAFCE|nr:proline-serine-threonine phosphatase-interacting protein 1-like [Periophthalmus magnuspinnatus]
MSPLMFKDAFWGSDFINHTGYEVIIHRLKDGKQMCKDVEELFKMRALAEEKYGKELMTISRKAGGLTEIGTLRASMEKLKAQIENIGSFHIQLSEILKEEVKKIETFRERQKEQRKKFESIMEKVHKKKASLFRKTMESKKCYELRCKEADEAEQTAERTISAGKNADKVCHKAKNLRAAANDAEKVYLTSVRHLESIRQDWEETHRSTCEVFQQLEGDRITTLRCALWDHCNHFSAECVKDDDLYEEVRKCLEECDITKDLNTFIEMNNTGWVPPGPVVFESYYQTDTDSGRNGNAHFDAGENYNTPHNTPATSWSFNPQLDTTASSNEESARNSRITLTSSGEIDILECGGYAPLPLFEQNTSTAIESADTDRWIVLYTYIAQEADEMSISRGDVVQVLERGEDGWWTVDRDGQRGLVPGNYLDKK